MMPKMYAVLFSVFLVACGPGPRGPAAAEGHDAGSALTNEPPPGVVELPASVRSNLGIQFARVERRSVTELQRLPGVFELEPDARREYRITLSGWVELAVEQYQHIEVGDLLYRFRAPAWSELTHEILRTEQDIESATAQIEVANARSREADMQLASLRSRIAALAEAGSKRAELDLEKGRIEARLPSLKALETQARVQLSNARRSRTHALRRAADAAGLSVEELEQPSTPGAEPTFEAMTWIEVRALDAGQVDALEVTDGAFVETPGLVLSTQDPTRVRLRAVALQGDLEALAQVSEATILHPGEPSGDSTESLRASVTLGLEAQPHERTLALIATPAARANWARPGVAAYLEVDRGGGNGPRVTIPRAAVLQDGLTHIFFRRDPGNPNRALRVEADMGASNERWVELKSGVALGDEVVVEGAYELRLAIRERMGGGPAAGTHVHADGTQHADH